MIRTRSVSIEEYISQEWCFEEDSGNDANEIISIIRQWSICGNWLDLGCGPMLTVWPMFSTGKTAIWGCDRNPDIAIFHEKLKYIFPTNWPVGLQNAIAFYNKNFKGPNDNLKISTPIHQIKKILVCNLLEEQKLWYSFFHTIIQIGCFGCLDSIKELESALDLVFRYLRPGGIFISATWLPRLNYVESEVWGGTKLSKLTADVFESAIRKVGLTVIETRVALLNDSQYHSRYVIVAKKNK